MRKAHSGLIFQGPSQNNCKLAAKCVLAALMSQALISSGVLFLPIEILQYNDYQNYQKNSLSHETIDLIFLK